MRPVQKYLSLIFLSVFITISAIIVPSVSAASNLLGIEGVKGIQDYVKEFCDKRSGDLMNLETWYSGKCAPGVDSLSGDGVGFVDIVILQGMEWVNTLMLGSPQDNFLDSVTKQLKLLKAFKDKLSSGNITPSQIDMA